MSGAFRRGMTLMELVVGITITGMMAAAGGAAFSSIIDHRRIIRQATIETERAAALRETIRGWLVAGTVLIQSGGVPRLGGGPAVPSPAATAPGGTNSSQSSSSSTGGNTAVSAAAATGDELTFTTTAPTPAMAPSVRMRLFIDGDPATPEHGLTLEYQPSTNAPLQRRELDSTITTLKVEFLDSRTNRWTKASDGAAITPSAVRLWFLPPEGGKLAGILQVPMVFRIGGGT